MTGGFPAPSGTPVLPAAAPARPDAPEGPVLPGPPGAPPTSAGPGPSGMGFMGRGTLSRRLVLRVTGLVALVAILLSTLTAGALYRILEAQLDSSVRSAAERIQKSDRPGGVVYEDELNCGGQEKGGPGLQQGLLMACSTFTGSNGTYPANGRVQLGNTSVTLTAQQMNQLVALPTANDPITINVDGLGPYRVISTVQFGRTVVTGLPLAPVTEPVGKVLLAAGLLTLIAIALAFVGARSVVQNSLKPLQRLAATAHQVSQLELRSGEVDVPVRVPEVDTDPRSEVGQVGMAFNHMLDNVEGALGARQRSETKVRQFVADASHELRNPLASIRGYAELTRRERDEVPPTTAHALGRIESESARMSSLVEDMLLLARLDSGPHYLTLRPTRMNELVANAVSDAQVAGPEHDWELSLPDAEIVALGDPFRLHQVVANLLSNARTHTPAGTLVTTSLTTEGAFAVVRVADNGPGIPVDIRDKVFERFTRADASRVRSGKGQSTGLGLAIVSAVVGAHHGTASVESSAAGTTFTVRIPLAR